MADYVCPSLSVPDMAYLKTVCSDEFVDGQVDGISYNERGVTTFGGTACPIATSETLVIPQPVVFYQDAPVSPAFSDQWCDAVHITPNDINIGNLLSELTYDVEVWNNHRHDMTLQQILESGTQGIDLGAPEAPPTVFHPNEWRMYQVSIYSVGPPVIDGRFTFDWVDYTMDITVTGKRVVVWPFVPQSDLSETIEFRTDILRTKAGEQRIARRALPRVSYHGTYFLQPQEFARVKSLMHGWGYRSFGVPVWPEAQFIGAVAAGTLVINVDTAESSYAVGDMIILHQQDDQYETAEIADITSTSITLDLATVSSYDRAYIMPVLFCNIDAVDLTRDETPYVWGTASFTATQTVDLSAATGKTQWRGKDVMLDKSVVLGSLREKLYTDVDTLDSQYGTIAVVPKYNHDEHEQTLSTFCHTRSALWLWKQWLYSLRGKQKSFWLPTWGDEIQITTALIASASSITCAAIGYALYYAESDILIELVDGTILLYHILGGADGGDGTERLQIDGQIGQYIALADIRHVCFVNHVRLDADRIEIKYNMAGQASISVPVRTVPEE